MRERRVPSLSLVSYCCIAGEGGEGDFYEFFLLAVKDPLPFGFTNMSLLALTELCSHMSPSLTNNCDAPPPEYMAV